MPTLPSPVAAIPHPFGDVRPFFAQLGLFSQRVFKRLGLPAAGSPWGRPMPQPMRMVGAVVHYTAAADMRSPMRWLCDPSLNPAGKESCHVIIGRERYSFAQGLDHDLPLVQALPVTVVQVRPPDTLANHATWANSMTYGIENDCAGVAQPGLGTQAFGNWWVPYTLPQLQTNVVLIQAYNAYCGGVFQPSWVLGHEHVETVHTVGYPVNKRDPGPLYPMHEVRSAVFGVRETGGVLDGTQTVAKAAVASRMALAALPVKDMVCRAKLGLALLGYLTGPPDSPRVEAHDSASVSIAQRALGLTADGVIGPRTLAALQARVADRLGDSVAKVLDSPSV